MHWSGPFRHRSFSSRHAMIGKVREMDQRKRLSVWHGFALCSRHYIQRGAEEAKSPASANGAESLLVLLPTSIIHHRDRESMCNWPRAVAGRDRRRFTSASDTQKTPAQQGAGVHEGGRRYGECLAGDRALTLYAESCPDAQDDGNNAEDDVIVQRRGHGCKVHDKR